MRKRWLVRISVFFVVQFIFILIDGTILEPLLNDLGHRMTQIVGPKLEWFTLYQSIYLKLVTMIILVYLVVAGVEDMLMFHRRKRDEHR